MSDEISMTTLTIEQQKRLKVIDIELNKLRYPNNNLKPTDQAEQIERLHLESRLIVTGNRLTPDQFTKTERPSNDSATRTPPDPRKGELKALKYVFNSEKKRFFASRTHHIIWSPKTPTNT